MGSHNPRPFTCRLDWESSVLADTPPMSSSDTICNSPNPRGISLSTSLRGSAFSLTCCLVSNIDIICYGPNPHGISQSTSLESPIPFITIQTHRSVSSSDTICNGPSPLLIDIVRFGPLHDKNVRENENFVLGLIYILICIKRTRGVPFLLIACM